MASYKYDASSLRRKPGSLQSRGLKAFLYPSLCSPHGLRRANWIALIYLHFELSMLMQALVLLLPVTDAAAAPAIIVHEAQFIVPPKVPPVRSRPIGMSQGGYFTRVSLCRRKYMYSFSA